jgi:hypothetical protein
VNSSYSVYHHLFRPASSLLFSSGRTREVVASVIRAHGAEKNTTCTSKSTKKKIAKSFGYNSPI